jgi:hypothetical protein
MTPDVTTRVFECQTAALQLTRASSGNRTNEPVAGTVSSLKSWVGPTGTASSDAEDRQHDQHFGQSERLARPPHELTPTP